MYQVPFVDFYDVYISFFFKHVTQNYDFYLGKNGLMLKLKILCCVYL